MKARYIGNDTKFRVGEIYNLKGIPMRSGDPSSSMLKNVIRVVDEDDYEKSKVYESMTKFMEDWEKINTNKVFTLRDFLIRYVSHNSLIRLWTETNDSNVSFHKMICDEDHEVLMAHHIIDKYGDASKYGDYEFIKVVDINCESSEYPEAINIVVRDEYSPKKEAKTLDVTFSKIY